MWDFFIVLLSVILTIASFLPFILVLGLLIFFAIYAKRSGKNNFVIKQSETNIIDNIVRNDIEFDGIIFKEYAINCIKEANEALLNMNVDKLRQYETNELFYIDKNKIDLAKKIGSLECFTYLIIGNFKLVDYKIENGKEILICKALVQTRKIKVDVNTNNVKKIDVSGMFHFMKFEFVRLNNLKNQKNICPNCGAPLNETFNGNCLYCNSIINNNQNKWLLNKCEENIFGA